MDVLVISVGDREAASTKYRVVQFEPFLRERGVALRFVHRREVSRHTVELAAQADVVLNQKSLFSNALGRRVADAAKRLVFDYDDAIYTRPGRPRSLLARLRTRRRLHLWLRRSDLVTTANHALARYAQRLGANVRVIPMSLDLERWQPVPCRSPGHVTIGWAGGPVNIPGLERLEPVLRTVLERHDNARLAVYSGKRPELRIPFDYHPFEPGTEPGFVQALDIGLLPLVDEEHARGKSPIKAIQYLACGVPVVGNIVGAAAEICTPANSIRVGSNEEWVAALSRLIEDREAATALGEAGRRHVEQHHDLRKNGWALLECLCPDQGEMASPPRSPTTS